MLWYFGCMKIDILLINYFKKAFRHISMWYMDVCLCIVFFKNMNELKYIFILQQTMMYRTVVSVDST